MESALFFGRLRHRRHLPVRHELSWPLFLAWLDLSELERVFRGRWLWSTSRPALVRFRREDHLGDPALPLGEAVRRLVAERTGRRPAGPVRLLTHLRAFGFVFNPVSFFYCYREDGRALEAIVADVHNTPWGERHAYVLPVDAPEGRRQHRFRFAKAFHVSPFMGMAQEYDWRFVVPGRRLVVHMQSHEAGRTVFDATLALRRSEIAGRSLARALVRHPAMPHQVVAAIYWNALRLWARGAPFHPHPGTPPTPALPAEVPPR